MSLVGHRELGTETVPCVPEVPLVRQLSAPRRLAVAMVTSLAVAASAGCMSVSDDQGGKPAPGKSSDRPGAVAEPDGGEGVSGGRHADGGRNGSGTAGDKRDGPEASPSAPGTAAPSAQPPSGGQQPRPPTGPDPTRGGSSPSAQPSQPQPPVEPSEPPPVDPPTLPPSEPTDAPSASSAPEVHAGAMRLADGQGTLGVPSASPQMGPM